MKPKITKSHVYGFFAGILFCIVIDLIFNWEEAKTSFMEGYNSVVEKAEVNKE